MNKLIILINRRLLFLTLGFVFLGACGGLLMSFLSPPKYSASLLFKVGGISNNSFGADGSPSFAWKGFADEFLVVENFLNSPEVAESLTEIIEKSAETGKLKTTKSARPNGIQVKENPKMPVISVKVFSEDKDAALLIVNSAASLLLEKENNKIDEWVNLLQQQASTLKKSIEFLNDFINKSADGSRTRLNSNKSLDQVAEQSQLLKAKSQLANYWINHTQLTQQIELQNLSRPAILAPGTADGSLLNSKLESALIGGGVGFLIGLLVLTFGVEVKLKP